MQIRNIILASTSSFRQALLKAMKIPFVAVASPFDEKTINHEDVRGLALDRALGKGQAVARLHPFSLVIGADQTLSFEGRSFEKANDPREAKLRLEELSGKTHFLHSALSITVYDGTQVKELVNSITDVPMTMRQLQSQEISNYLALNEWQGVVGCYQAENAGSHLFAHAGGETAAIMGLPQIELLRMLRTIGINILVDPQGPWELQLPAIEIIN